MSKARRIISTKVATEVSPDGVTGEIRNPNFMISETPFGSEPGASDGNVQELKPVMYIKRPVPWKGAPEFLPEGTKEGLSIAIGTSKAAMNVFGTTVDPKTGYVVPTKAVKQREASPVSAEEKHKRRLEYGRQYRAPGTVPAEKLGITPRSLPQVK